MEQTKQTAIEFINNGGKSIYRYGWGWKGAKPNYKTKEWALDELSKPRWDFGKGFYELSWRTIDGETILEFNELSVNDMW